MNLAQTGTYLYRLNGEPASVGESWRRESQGAGCCRITSGRRAGDVAIDIEAVEHNGLVTWFTAQWRDADTRTRSVEYTLRDRTLIVLCRDGRDVAGETETVLDSERTLLFPLMRIFTGPVLTGLLRGGGTGDVVVPDITPDVDSTHLLLPLFSGRRVEVVSEETLEDEAGEPRHCRRCLYLGGRYDKDAAFWIGPDGLLEQYQWQQDPGRFWEVTLRRDS